MGFQLAEAFVSLTQRGFNTALIDIDNVERILRSMQTAAVDSTAAFDFGLVEAVAKAAAEMKTFTDAADVVQARLQRATQVTERLSQTIASVQALNIQIDDSELNEVLSQLGDLQDVTTELSDTEIDFLEKLEADLSKYVAHRADMEAINKAFKAADDAAKPLKKTLEELNKEAKEFQKLKTLKIDVDSDKVRSQLSSVFETIAEGKDELESVREKIEAWKDETEGVDQTILSTLGKAGRMIGLITLVAGAAKQVYDWVINWQLEASGFNAEMQRSIALEKQFAELRQQTTQRAIAAAGRLTSVGAKRLALEKAIRIAKEESQKANENRDIADEARTPGLLGQFADGKLNKELEPEFERASIAAESAEKSLKSLESTLENLNRQTLDNRANIAEQVKEETIAANEGAIALETYKLQKQGLSLIEAKEVVLLREIRRLNKEDADRVIEITNNYKQQTAALNLKLLALQKGEAAAAREADANEGFDVTQQDALASLRDRIATEEKLQAEKAKAAAEEEAKQDRIEQSFARQVEALRLKNIELAKGPLAAKAEADRLAGFNKEQREELIKLRQEQAALENEKKEERDAERARESRARSNGPEFIGLADLASKMQQAIGDARDKQAAQNTARDINKLARQAEGEGLKIRTQGVGNPPPSVDRRFGRGSTSETSKQPVTTKIAKK